MSSFISWESLNASLNPDEKRQLLEGTLTRFICPKCNHHSSVNYPMLYHDMDRQFMVWLWPGDEEPELGGAPGFMKGYAFRIVETPNGLIEKILIFESELDDRIIEFAKLFASVQSEKSGAPLGELLFEGIEQANSPGATICFIEIKEGGKCRISIPLEHYRFLGQKLASYFDQHPLPAQPWPRVNRAYAITLANDLSSSDSSKL